VYTWGFRDKTPTPVLTGLKVVKVEAGGNGFCGALTGDREGKKIVGKRGARREK
jgi:hypothetical protein